VAIAIAGAGASASFNPAGDGGTAPSFVDLAALFNSAGASAGAVAGGVETAASAGSYDPAAECVSFSFSFALAPDAVAVSTPADDAVAASTQLLLTPLLTIASANLASSAALFLRQVVVGMFFVFMSRSMKCVFS
jgi:hypothetical protein